MISSSPSAAQSQPGPHSVRSQTDRDRGVSVSKGSLTHVLTRESAHYGLHVYISLQRASIAVDSVGSEVGEKIMTDWQTSILFRDVIHVGADGADWIVVGTLKRSLLFSCMAIVPENSSQYFENSFITSPQPHGTHVDCLCPSSRRVRSFSCSCGGGRWWLLILCLDTVFWCKQTEAKY